MPRLRVEARRRLVQKHQLRIVDERAREREPPFHATRQRLYSGVLAGCETRELEKIRYAGLDIALAQAEVAAVHEQVFAHGEIGIEIVDLRNYTDARTCFTRVLRNGKTQYCYFSGIRLAEAETQAQRRRLARAVGAEQTETHARFELEIEARDNFHGVVGLAQIRHTQMPHVQRQ